MKFPMPGWVWADAFHLLAEEAGAYFFSSDFRFMRGVVSGAVDYYNYSNPFQKPDQNADFYSSLARSFLNFLRGPGMITCAILPDAYKFAKGLNLSGEGASTGAVVAPISATTTVGAATVVGTGSGVGAGGLATTEGGCFCCFHLSHPGAPPPCPAFSEEGQEEEDDQSEEGVVGGREEGSEEKEDKLRGEGEKKEAGKLRFGLVKSLRSLSGWKGGEEEERGRGKGRRVTMGGGGEDLGRKKGRSNSFGQVVVKPTNNNIINNSDDGSGGFGYSSYGSQGSISSYSSLGSVSQIDRTSSSTPNGDIRKRSHTTSANLPSTNLSIRKNGISDSDLYTKTPSTNSDDDTNPPTIPNNVDFLSTNNPFPLSLTRGFDWEMEREREEREREAEAKREKGGINVKFLDMGVFTGPPGSSPFPSSPPSLSFPSNSPPSARRPLSIRNSLSPPDPAITSTTSPSPVITRVWGGGDETPSTPQTLSFSKKKQKKKKRSRRSPESKRGE